MIPAPANPPPPVVVAPLARRRRTGLIVGLVVAALVVIGGGLAIALAALRANSPASAKVGDCLSFDRDKVELKRADCGSATHRLIGFADSARGCAEIPGATQAVPGRERTYCLADVNDDPTKAINTVKAGGCVTVVGQEAQRSGCAAGSYPVLAVLKNQVRASPDDLDYTCTGVEGTENAYGWSISGDPSVGVGTWDRILCLGAKK